MSEIDRLVSTDPQRKGVLFNLLDSLLSTSPNVTHLLHDLTRFYDNLRPSYSPCATLEFGGLILSPAEIHDLVDQQVCTLFRGVSPRRVLLIWKKRTAYQYMMLLKRAITQHYQSEVICQGIQTRWLGERTVEFVTNPVLVQTTHHVDSVLCIDSFIGTGNTFARLHECLDRNRIAKPLNLVLVDLQGVTKDYQPVFHEPYVKAQANYWIIGFNADCLANGKEHGRDIPFLGYLVPKGTGVRNAILKRYRNHLTYP